MLLLRTGAAPRRPAPLPPCPYGFPDARRAPPHGLVAAGGDFAPATVVAAYRAGCFPWPHGDDEHLWFSPDPRAVIPVGGLHVSKRLARTVRSGRFSVTMDVDFGAVMRGCADRPEGTWITESLVRGYLALNRLGWAHSFEVWHGEGFLAGGLYGVRVGRMFGAESMFFRVTDASKVAMVAMMEWVESEGIELVDVQVVTEHTARMGAVEISREEYLRRLAAALRGGPG
ncbi:MAG: leucyl/phenylalanyl-tRNA--protein transferase [Dehalococcoidia bacterium]